MRSHCGASQSEWSNGSMFVTNCEPISVFPYTEGFDDYMVGEFPICWYRPLTFTAQYVPYETPCVSATQISQSPKSLAFATTNGTSSYVISPALNSTLNSLQVSFVMMPQDIAGSGIM